MQFAPYIDKIKYTVNYIKIKKQASLQHLYHAIAMLLVILILMSTFMTLRHPVGQMQIHQLEQLAHQHVYPHTQHLATYVLTQQNHVSYGQYLKVIHAHQMEQQHAQHLPALKVKSSY